MKDIFSKASLFKKRKRDSSETTRRLSDTFNEHKSVSSESLQEREMECLLDLIDGCQQANIQVSNKTVFRFAAYYDFNYDRARAAILGRYDDPHLHLRMEGDLMEQFENLVVFPLPGGATTT